MSYHKVVHLKRLYHRGASRIGLVFPYDEELITVVKSINAQWSQANKCWYLTNNPTNLKRIFQAFKGKAWVDKEEFFNHRQSSSFSSQQREEVKPKRDCPASFIKKLTMKRYSKNTIRTYTSMLREFINYYPKKSLKNITQKEIERYLVYLVEQRRVSRSYQNQAINAIKFYYEQVLGRDRQTYYIERPRKKRTLPKVLPEATVMHILHALSNLKHRALLTVLYSSGLRVSELVGLRKHDINYDKNIIFVRGGKGKKDRTTLLADKAADILERYLSEYKPNYWLFEGPHRKSYSTSSVRAVLRKATRKAGVEQRVTPHMLRHSFATHLLEQGTDIMYIQRLLGHRSPKTTAVYVKVSQQSLANVTSPLDAIMERESTDNKGKTDG